MLSYVVLCCLILSYLVLSYLVLSCLVWSDLALSSRRRRQVPASREATRYLGDVMGQQSWEARAFGVRASALLAERFPTEKVAWLARMVRPPGSELPCFAPFVRGLLHRGVVFCAHSYPKEDLFVLVSFSSWPCPQIGSWRASGWLEMHVERSWR